LKQLAHHNQGHMLDTMAKGKRSPASGTERNRADNLSLSSFPIPRDARDHISEINLVMAGMLSVILDPKCPPAMEEWAKLQGMRIRHRREKGQNFDPEGSLKAFLEHLSDHGVKL